MSAARTGGARWDESSARNLLEQLCYGHSIEVTAILRFADGSTGSILYSSLGDSALPKEYLEVFAAGTVIRLDDFRKLHITRGGKTTTKSATAQDKGQAGLVAAFYAAARNGATAPIVLDELVAISAATLQIAGAVVLDAMAQRQVLRACGGADRVGLHETQAHDGALQGRGFEQRAGDCIAPQRVESRVRHAVIAAQTGRGQ